VIQFTLSAFFCASCISVRSSEGGRRRAVAACAAPHRSCAAEPVNLVRDPAMNSRIPLSSQLPDLH
jgi:hypothetical protein